MRDADEENVNENLMTCLPFKIALNGWPHHRECLKIAIRLSFDKLFNVFFFQFIGHCKKIISRIFHHLIKTYGAIVLISKLEFLT